MKKKFKFNIESGFACVMALVSALFLHFSLQMDTGSITLPGPGFVPALIGGTGLIVSLLLFITSYKGAEKHDKESATREGIIRFIGYLVTMIAFVPLFKFAGTIIALFIMVLALTKISGSKGWVYPVVLAAICSGLTYAVFKVALGVPLPTGIF